MTKPSSFILNTDYATLKNDGKARVTFIIPASVAIPSSGTYSYIATTDVTVGSKGAVTRTSINTAVEPSTWYSGSYLKIIRQGTHTVFGTYIYTVHIYLTVDSVGVVTANLLIQNDSGTGTLTTEASTRSVTIDIATFLPPFTA